MVLASARQYLVPDMLIYRKFHENTRSFVNEPDVFIRLDARYTRLDTMGARNSTAGKTSTVSE